MPLETRTIENVELIAEGRWHGNGCPEDGCEFTTEYLDSVVTAYKATKGNFDAPVKLGHDDKQKLLQADGYPAAGWVTNLRRAGKKLIGDLRDVPKVVAELIQSGAYRKRSAELRENFEVDGKEYPVVFTGLALLGADLPAVEGLNDIRALYSKLQLELDDNAKIIVLQADGHMDDMPSLVEELDDLVERMEAVMRGQKGTPAARMKIREVRQHLAALVRAAKGASMSLVTLAEWTTAYINDLPDGAFAYVGAGGRKDDSGRTVPRGLRYLPHHDDAGKIDLPHLRNALARAPQTNLPAAAKAQAIRHLAAHAKTEGVGEENAA